MDCIHSLLHQAFKIHSETHTRMQADAKVRERRANKRWQERSLLSIIFYITSVFEWQVEMYTLDVDRTHGRWEKRRQWCLLLIFCLTQNEPTFLLPFPPNISFFFCTNANQSGFRDDYSQVFFFLIFSCKCSKKQGKNCCLWKTRERENLYIIRERERWVSEKVARLAFAAGSSSFIVLHGARWHPSLGSGDENTAKRW